MNNFESYFEGLKDAAEQIELSIKHFEKLYKNSPATLEAHKDALNHALREINSIGEYHEILP